MSEIETQSDAQPLALERGPLVFHLRPAVELTRDQFFELCQLNRDIRLERTAQGDVLIMPPTGGKAGARNALLGAQITAWAQRDGTGIVFDSSTGFELPNGAVRSPDVSWVQRARLTQLTAAQKEKFLPLCPDFVVELRSPSDSLAAAQEKMEEYLGHGAQLGWLIDAAARRVYAYRAGAAIEHLDQPSRLSADPVLPGFVLDLGSVWDPGI